MAIHAGGRGPGHMARKFGAYTGGGLGGALPAADATDWATFATAFNAKRAGGGGTIYLAPGTYVGSVDRLMATAPANPAFTPTGAKVIVRAQDPANPPYFGSAVSSAAFTCNVSDVEFYGIDFTVGYLWPAKACINQTTTDAARQTYRNCLLAGPAFDPNDTTLWRCEGVVDSAAGTYGVAGTLIIDITGGSSPVTVNILVGDADATATVNRINAAISAAGQSASLAAVKLSANTIRIQRMDQTTPNMAGKVISLTGTLVAGLGFGSAGNKTVTVRPIPTYATLISAGQAVNGISIQGCTIRYLREGYKPPKSTGGYFNIDYNDMYYIGGDAIQISPYDVNPPVGNSIKFNRIWGPIALGSDTGDHIDAVQFTAASTAQTTKFSDCDITGNVIVDFLARGQWQFLFFSDQSDNAGAEPLGYWSNVRVKGNVFVTAQGNAHMPTMDHIIASYIYGNTSVRSQAGAVNGNQPKLNPSGLTGYESNYVAKNIVATIGADPNCQFENNTVLGNDCATLTTYFPSANGSYSDIVDVINKFSRSDGLAGYVNYINRTIDQSKEVGVVNFTKKTGQPVSSLVYSDWSLLKGGGAGQPWSVTGGVIQFADDALGTNSTGDLSGSGTVNEGKYVRIGFTTPATGSTNKSASALFQGSRVNTFTARTTNLVNYSTAYNQGSAYSQMASAPTSVSGFNKFLFAARVKRRSDPTFPNYVFARSSTTTHLSLQTGPKWRMQLLGSGNRVDWTAPAADNTWHTIIVSWDLSRVDSDPNNLVKVVMDGVLQTPSSVGCDLSGNANYNQATAIGLLQMFGLSGANFLDGDIGFVYADWGGSGYSLIDITQESVFNMFEPDWINLSNGSGPTGAQPKLFYMADATGWNAGFANKGSLGIAMNAPSAGTYV